MKGAGEKRVDDGGPHHHHDGGGELGGVAEDRGQTTYSLQQGEGQEGVFEEVNVGSQDLHNRSYQPNCLAQNFMSCYEILETCDAICFEYLLNFINSLLFEPRKL